MSSGIYMYKNLVNGKCYIGQSNSLESRKIAHKTRTFNNYESNNEYGSLLHKSMRKYGYDNFQYSILEECSASDLSSKEKYWIEEMNSFVPNGYNLTKGGEDGQRGILKHISEEQFYKVVDLLKNSMKTHREIEEETGVSVAYISNIRNGLYMKQEDEAYPLRPFNTALTINGEKIKSKHKLCPKCGKQIWNTSEICAECFQLSQRKVERPEAIYLAKEIIELGFEAVGRKYGVSGNTIKKWCIAYGMGKLKHEVAVWYENNKAS